MGLGRLVVVAGPVGDADGGHQRDPYSSVADRRQHVAYALVVDRTSPHLALTVGAEGEDDGVDPFEGGGQRLRASQRGTVSTTRERGFGSS